MSPSWGTVPSPLSTVYMLHLLKVLLRIALVEIVLKDFVKVIRHRKILRGPERPLQSDIERIKILIEGNLPLTTRELSAMFGCNQSTIDRHLHHIGKVNKLGT